jgi:hypothetical protein
MVALRIVCLFKMQNQTKSACKIINLIPISSSAACNRAPAAKILQSNKLCMVRSWRAAWVNQIPVQCFPSNRQAESTVGFRVHFQHQNDQQSLSKYSPIKLANIQSNFIVYNAKLSQVASQKKRPKKASLSLQSYLLTTQNPITVKMAATHSRMISQNRDLQHY